MIPYVRAIGSLVASADPVSPAWPDHDAGDIGILLVEVEEGGTDPTLGVAAGFVHVTGSPLLADGGAGATNGSKFGVFWCRATSGAMGSPTVADSGDHQAARIFTIRGCRTTGDPFEAVATATDASTASHTFPAVTTLGAERLILFVGSIHTDGGTYNIGGTNFTNANLIQHPGFILASASSVGNGGGFYALAGLAEDAGDIGTTAVVTNAPTTSAMFTLAFVPEPDEVPDEVNPEITIVSPAPEDGVGPTSVITVDLTDDVGLSSYVVIAEILDVDTGEVIDEDVVHDGVEFGLHYQGAINTIAAISGGYRLRVRRDDGWHGSPRFRYILRDTSGNVGVLA